MCTTWSSAYVDSAIDPGASCTVDQVRKWYAHVGISHVPPFALAGKMDRNHNELCECCVQNDCFFGSWRWPPHLKSPLFLGFCGFSHKVDIHVKPCFPQKKTLRSLFGCATWAGAGVTLPSPQPSGCGESLSTWMRSQTVPCPSRLGIVNPRQLFDLHTRLKWHLGNQQHKLFQSWGLNFCR